MYSLSAARQASSFTRQQLNLYNMGGAAW